MALPTTLQCTPELHTCIANRPNRRGPLRSSAEMPITRWLGAASAKTAPSADTLREAQLCASVGRDTSITGAGNRSQRQASKFIQHGETGRATEATEKQYGASRGVRSTYA